MMKVLVTGASGFIGSKIVEILATQPEVEILATGRTFMNRFSSFPSVNYFQQDLLTALPSLACEIVVHCAGLADDRSTKEELILNNAIATKNLLQAVQNCRLFIFISSASVYDFSNGQSKEENDFGPEEHLSDYGVSKLMAETIVKNSGISSVYILRPRAVYGPGDRVLLPRILQLIRRDRMIIPGRLSTKTSLTHINNLCEAILTSIQQVKPGTHIYNVSDRQCYDLNEVFEAICLRKTKKKNFIQIPQLLIKLILFTNQSLGIRGRLNQQSVQYLSQYSVLDISTAREQLNYQGRHNFFDSIDQLDI